MASRWSQLFLQQNGKKRISPILLIFIAFQLLILVVIIVNIVTVNNGEVDDDATRYRKMPELTIKDFSAKMPTLSDYEITDIQKRVFKIVSENTSNISTEDIEAVIREEDTHVRDFGNNVVFANMIVDIPSLGQTYQLIIGTNAVLDPEISAFVLCPDAAKLANSSFNCKSSDMDIRNKIVPTYLRYFKFEYFSAYITAEKPDTITISPSVTYDNNEPTKNSYINEVRDSVESLGVSPDSYKYYVRTADDVNYRN